MDSEFQANVNNYWQKIFGSDELVAIFATRFETALKANDGNEERCSEKAGSSLEKNFGGKHTDRIFAVRFKRSKSSSQKGVAQPGKTERKGRKKNLVEFAKTSTFATHFKKNERLKAARSSGVKKGNSSSKYF